MQVSKWGNSLAIRLPVELVRQLDLREGDQLSIRAEKFTLVAAREPRPEEILEGLRRFRGRLKAEQKLDRDAAHER